MHISQRAATQIGSNESIMGFSSALQSRAAHEALIVRQDAELRLMETMKRSIQMKAKCDKEYAISLTAVAQQGLKIDRADEMQGKTTGAIRLYSQLFGQWYHQYVKYVVLVLLFI